MTTEQRFERMEQRIDGLETQVYRYRFGGIAVALIGITILLVGATLPKEGRFDMIETQFLKISDGSAMISARAVKGRIVLGFKGANGKAHILIRADDENGGTMRIFDSQGRIAASISANSGGNGILKIHNASSVLPSAVLTADPGGGSLKLYNTNASNLINRTEGFFAGIDSVTNGAFMQLFNQGGEPTVQLRSDGYGNGVVGAYNHKGEGRELRPGPEY